MAILSYLRHFKPFQIDALGIVTLLGAEEINNSVGKLVRSRYLEYLPLMGNYVFANDSFARKQSGFEMYNFSQGISTPELAAWFSRWLMAQEFSTSCSVVDFTVRPPQRPILDYIIATTMGVIVNGGFLALTVLMGDWWGFANAVAMALSTIWRAYLVSSNRSWLNAAVAKALQKKYPKYPKDVEYDHVNDPLAKAKVLVVMSDSKAVAVRIPAFLVRTCFALNPTPVSTQEASKRVKTWRVKSRDEGRGPIGASEGGASRQLDWYKSVRWLMWATFGIHVVTIGMSDLISQMMTVVILVGSTFWMAQGLGCDDSSVGSCLTVKISDFPAADLGVGRRGDLYAFLDLNEDESNSLEKWNLVPHRHDKQWWEEFEKKKKLYNEPKPILEFNTWDERLVQMRRRIIEGGAPLQPDLVEPTTHTSHATA